MTEEDVARLLFEAEKAARDFREEKDRERYPNRWSSFGHIYHQADRRDPQPLPVDDVLPGETGGGGRVPSAPVEAGPNYLSPGGLIDARGLTGVKIQRR